jgi:polyisoprenoid-binding protein YceI
MILERVGLWMAMVVGAGLASGPTMQGQQQKLVVDTAKSGAHFTLVDTLHTVHGTFKVMPGVVQFNPATGAAGGSIVVDALSGASGNSTRDRRMNKEELKVEEYKTVTFAPVRFAGKFNASGDSTITVHGAFTILGVAHEMDVPMQIQVNGTQFHASGTFAVPYVKWGLKDPSVFAIKVNKEVQIDLLLVGMLEQ